MRDKSTDKENIGNDKNIKTVLQKIISISEKTAHQTGDIFFKSLTVSLCESFNMRYAFIALLISKSYCKVQTLWDGNCFHSEDEYALENTPCSNVINKYEPCFYLRDFQNIFPNYL